MTPHVPDSDRNRLPNTAERYAALPDTTRQFIERLHEDDIEKLKGVMELNKRDIENLQAFRDLLNRKGIETITAAVEMAEDMRTAKKFAKFGIATLLAIVPFTAAVVALYIKIMEWWRPTGVGH